jgi:uncharacterized protein
VPRKYFRKFLPSHDSMRGRRQLQWLGPLLHHHNLWHLHKRSVAGGFAIGMFAGMIPVPIHMLSAAILAMLFRVNLPVAVATTWYANPVTVLPIYYLALKIGEFFTGMTGSHVPEFGYDWRTHGLLGYPPALFKWSLALGPSLLLGCFIMGLLLAGLGYLLVRYLWDLHIVIQWRRRKARRLVDRNS